MGVQRGFIELDGAANSDGVRLAYEEAGSGYPLVLLHGFTLDLRVWEPQFLHFARRRRVIRYDLRGFGASTLPGETPYRHVDELARLLGELGISRADLAGLSLGGGIALDFALVYPEAVRSLVLVDSILGGVRWSQPIADEFRAVNRAARETGIAAGRERWLSHPFFAPTLARDEAAAPLRDMIARYSGWHWLNRDPAVAIEPPAVARLVDIHAPTLVITGARDVPDIRAMAEMLASGISNARQVVIPHAGHLPNIEVPEEFNRLVGEFLDHLDAVEAPGG